MKTKHTPVYVKVDDEGSILEMHIGMDVVLPKGKFYDVGHDPHVHLIQGESYKHFRVKDKRHRRDKPKLVLKNENKFEIRNGRLRRK